MSPLWVQDGNLIINEDGAALECDECPCGTASASIVPTISCGDLTVAECWEVEISGFIDGAQSCEQNNGTFQLTDTVISAPCLGGLSTSDCAWRDPSDTNNEKRLFIDGEDVRFEICQTFLDSSCWKYKMKTAYFDETGENTLSLYLDSCPTRCNAVPSTVVIRGIECP